MKALRDLRETLRSSLWFLPTLVVAGAVALALALIEVDSQFGVERLTKQWPRVFGAGAEGSRGLLSAIAGSMITVAGVTFSITVVALTLASAQYTSRILGNFMRDRANQAVLGVFVGVFAYCLVVLRTIRGGDERAFVPSIAVLTAILLAFVAIGFLIFFIHHIAASIQAWSVIEKTAAATLVAVDRLFPARVGDPAESEASHTGARDAFEPRWAVIRTLQTGYIRAVDGEALFEVACKAGVVLRMERAIGEFVIEDAPLASIAGADADDQVIRRVNAAYSIGRDRTVDQDATFGIRQLVDVALKALSPGINDTTTAINCIDYLGAILARLAPRPVAPRSRGSGGQLRLIARGPTFSTLLGEAIDQIRQNAEGNVAVIRRLLEMLMVVAQRTSDESRRSTIRQQAGFLVDLAERSVPAEHDRAPLRLLGSQVAATHALQGTPASDA